MADALVPDSFLLLDEGEGNKRGREEVGVTTGEAIQGTCINPELHVAKPEHRGAQLREKAKVFAWLQEQKNRDETGRGISGKRGPVALSQRPDLSKNR
jgi:hypothetical protein